MKENVVKSKSFAFAVSVVKTYQSIYNNSREPIMSKQFLRSGTSVGAMIREAEHAETKNDFRHNMALAQKEINETIYWIDLLKETGYIPLEEHENISRDAIEILKLVTSILKTSKLNQ